MILTSSYNFQMPEFTDQADIRILNNNMESLDDILTLMSDMIEGTSQTVTFNIDSKIESIIHKNISDEIIRTDSFVYGVDSIIETRTLQSGKYVAITIDTSTYNTTISDFVEP